MSPPRCRAAGASSEPWSPQRAFEGLAGGMKQERSQNWEQTAFLEFALTRPSQATRLDDCEPEALPVGRPRRQNANANAANAKAASLALEPVFHHPALNELVVDLPTAAGNPSENGSIRVQNRAAVESRCWSSGRATCCARRARHGG